MFAIDVDAAENGPSEVRYVICESHAECFRGLDLGAMSSSSAKFCLQSTPSTIGCLCRIDNLAGGEANYFKNESNPCGTHVQLPVRHGRLAQGSRSPPKCFQ